MNKKYIIALVAVLIVIGACVYFYKHNTQSTSEVAICTADALICPDGSGVGRQGAQCAFAACPNQPSYTGTLRQIEGKFYLEMQAPAGLPEQAGTYNMPLHFKMVTNVLGQIVNKKVQVFGAFEVGNTLEVDHLEELKA